MNWSEVCPLCIHRFNMTAHAIFIAVGELGEATEDTIAEYVNKHLIMLTPDDLHERIALHFADTDESVN